MKNIETTLIKLKDDKGYRIIFSEQDSEAIYKIALSRKENDTVFFFNMDKLTLKT